MVKDELTDMINAFEELTKQLKINDASELRETHGRLLNIISEKIWREHLLPFAEIETHVSIAANKALERAKAIIEVYGDD